MGRRRKKKDKYGIFEFSEYGAAPAKKKKKSRPGGLIRLLVVCLFLTVFAYGAAFGVKYSMRVRGIAIYTDGNYESAIPLFEEALKPKLLFLEDFDNDVRFYLADCYTAMGEYGDACSMFGQIELWSDGSVKEADEKKKLSYGLLLFTRKEYREALPILLNAYENGYGDLVLYVGNCYGQTGDLKNMQLYYNIYLQEHPMNGFMNAQYAAISLDEGKLEDAAGYIEEGKKLEDDTNRKELLFDEIVYYEKQKDYDTAFEKAKLFVESFPGDQDGKNEYDLLYTRQKISD